VGGSHTALVVRIAVGTAIVTLTTYPCCLCRYGYTRSPQPLAAGIVIVTLTPTVTWWCCYGYTHSPHPHVGGTAMITLTPNSPLLLVLLLHSFHTSQCCWYLYGYTHFPRSLFLIPLCLHSPQSLHGITNEF